MTDEDYRDCNEMYESLADDAEALRAENASLKAEVARLTLLLTTARHEFDGDVPPHSAQAQEAPGDCY